MIVLEKLVICCLVAGFIIAGAVSAAEVINPVPVNNIQPQAKLVISSMASPVMFSSSPPNATLYIDGALAGTDENNSSRTPRTVNGIAAGNHTYRLTLSGYYDFTDSFSINPAGAPATFFTVLQPKPTNLLRKVTLSKVEVSNPAARGQVVAHVEEVPTNAPIPKLNSREPVRVKAVIPGGQNTNKTGPLAGAGPVSVAHGSQYLVARPGLKLDLTGDTSHDYGTINKQIAADIWSNQPTYIQIGGITLYPTIPGEYREIVVPVKITDAHDITSMALSIHYGCRLNFVSVEKSTLTQNSQITSKNVGQLGDMMDPDGGFRFVNRLNISLIDPKSISGNGELLTLKFKYSYLYPYTPPSEYFTLPSNPSDVPQAMAAAMAAAQEEAIRECEDGASQPVEVFSYPLPNVYINKFDAAQATMKNGNDATLVPLSGFMQFSQDPVRGDCDNNGVVDADDVSTALNEANSGNYGAGDIMRCDMNYNGKIDPDDALRILQLVTDNNAAD